MRHALRVSMACLAVGLTVAAFQIAQLAPPGWGLAAVFAIACAARLQNDWRDRFHDLAKGKALASLHPRLFLAGVVATWGVCCLLIAASAGQSAILALILSAMAAAGLLYSETRRVPWLPITVSAAASAAPALLPLALGAEVARILPLFGAAALLMFGREILKDIEDEEFDLGYKWTIPVAHGNRAARMLAMSSIAAACVAAATISAVVVVGIAASAVGIVLVWRKALPGTTMRWLDLGAALTIAALVACSPGMAAWPQ